MSAESTVAERIASNFTSFAGSSDNALALVNALRTGTNATLTYSAQSTTPSGTGTGTGTGSGTGTGTGTAPPPTTTTVTYDPPTVKNADGTTTTTTLKGVLQMRGTAASITTAEGNSGNHGKPDGKGKAGG